MRRSFISGAVASVAMFGVVAAASAQVQTYSPVGLSVRFGGFVPTSSYGTGIGKDWLAFGAEFNVVKIASSAGSSSHLTLSVDDLFHSSASEYPLLLNYKVHSGDVFGSVGAGVSFVNGGGNTSSEFAYQAGVGYDFKEMDALRPFIEAKFWGNGQSKYDGFGFYVGLRF